MDVKCFLPTQLEPISSSSFTADMMMMRFGRIVDSIEGAIISFKNGITLSEVLVDNQIQQNTFDFLQKQLSVIRLL